MKNFDRMSQLKVVAIGGFGHVGSVLDDMAGMSEAEVVGLSPAYAGEDISPFTGHLMCQKAKCFDDYSSMLKAVKPDVAIISTRLDQIPVVAIAAAQEGCCLISEKPMALDHGTLDRVYQAVKGSGVKAVSMLSMRSEPQFRAARRIYQSGAIGQAVQISGRKSYKWGRRPEWFGDNSLYGGTIGWVGIHALDFINYVTDLEFTSVSAMQGNFCHFEYPACQDFCGLVLSTSNGGCATISVDFLRPTNAATWGDDWIRIVGTKGVLEASGSRSECTVLTDGAEPSPVKLPERGLIFRDFLLSLQDGRKCELTQQASFMLTSACLFARDAAEQGTVTGIEHRDWD